MGAVLSPASRRARPLVAAGSCTVELDADILAIVRADARARHQSVKDTLSRWIRERAEDAAAERSLERAIQDNKGKPSIAAEDLYRECGL